MYPALHEVAGMRRRHHATQMTAWALPHGLAMTGNPQSDNSVPDGRGGIAQQGHSTMKDGVSTHKEMGLPLEI